MTLVVNNTTTIFNDQFDAAANAIEYGATDISVTIDTSVFVSSTDSNGVFSNQNSSTLVNNGNIFSASTVIAAAVRFEGNNGVITNNAGHNIAGTLFGVYLDGDNATLTNHGKVFGYDAVGVRHHFAADSGELINDGEIYGRTSGIQDFSTVGGATIVNSGLIDSDSIGVRVITASGLTTVIDNLAGGTIQGSDAAIFVTVSGRISLDNRGIIDGVVDSNAGTGNVNDTIVNRGKITGDVFLGDGNDTFRGKGGGTSGDVFGEDGNDTLIGGKKNDTLKGGPGDDMIRGHRGKDKLFGGADDDSFDFNSVKESVRGGKRDKIMDFVRGDDEIDLKNIDAKKGVGGNNKFHWIGKNDFHDKKGELRYEDKGAKVIVQGDVDGDGKAELEILVKVGKLSDHDFVL